MVVLITHSRHIFKTIFTLHDFVRRKGTLLINLKGLLVYVLAYLIEEAKQRKVLKFCEFVCAGYQH